MEKPDTWCTINRFITVLWALVKNKHQNVQALFETNPNLKTLSLNNGIKIKLAI